MSVRAVFVTVGALVASTAAVLGGGGPAPAAPESPQAPAAARATATLPPGFTDTVAIGGVTEPVGAAFAPDGTAFVALKTGLVKSFDYAGGAFEASASATDFADLTVDVNNYGDRGLTGITVDPQFPARPYVYVNYTVDKDPTGGRPGVPAWGDGVAVYDECGPDDADEASLTDLSKPGCLVSVRVSRLTAQRSAQGWTMVPGSEKVLVESGCYQFSSHTSGDVVFGPDGKLYASAGDGASFRGQDQGQNNACGDPENEGGSLRAQDVRGTGTGDPLTINGTIFRLDPDAGLAPSQATAGQWLVAYGQRNPWRLTFRPGTTQLWSVDVGSSNFEELNRLDAATAASTNLVNRGWPCYEGITGTPQVNAAWDALDVNLCESLYPNGANEVQAPYFAYRTRTGATPLTAGENCPVTSSSLSGVAFLPGTSTWPAAYKGSLYFTDFLRGCIWRLGTLPNGEPDPSSVQVFAQAAGAPVQLMAGPGGDLYYIDYGLGAEGPVEGAGAVHRIKADPAPTAELTVKAKRVKKLKIKVDGEKERTPFAATYAVGSVVKLVAPRSVRKKGVRYVFTKWQGLKDVRKKAQRKRKQQVTITTSPVVLKAVYRRVPRG